MTTPGRKKRPTEGARRQLNYMIRISCSGSGPRELDPRRHGAGRRRNGRRYNPQSVRSPLARAVPLNDTDCRRDDYFQGDLTRGHDVLPLQAGALPNSQPPTPVPQGRAGDAPYVGCPTQIVQFKRRTGQCPLWVKSRHVHRNRACPLYSQKRPRKRIPAKAMSALPPKAEIHAGPSARSWRSRRVRAYDKMRRVCGAAHTVYRAAREILVASF